MKEFERDDPLELVGIGYPVAVPEETDRETARCLVEEYALSGFSAFEVGALFESPAYALPHAIYKRRGADFVRTLVENVFGSRR
jgi:hypothetical protein